MLQFKFLAILSRKKNRKPKNKTFPSFETIMKRLAPLSFSNKQHRAFGCEYGALGPAGRCLRRGPCKVLRGSKSPAFGGFSSFRLIYLIFKLPTRRSRYSFQPPAPFGSKVNFCLLSDSSAWNYRDPCSDTCLQFLCFCSLIIAVFLPISTLTLKLNL